MSIASDLKLAYRTIRTERLVSATVVVTAGAVVCLATALFSALQSVVLRPLPYPDPDRVVVVGKAAAASGRPAGTSEPEFLDWQARARSFDGMAALRRTPLAFHHDDIDWLEAALVTPNFFDVLGVAARIGRLFEVVDGTSGARPIVISERFWRGPLGGDASVIGRAIRLSDVVAGTPAALHTIVGVLPSEIQIRYPGGYDIYLPLVITPREHSAGARRAIGPQVYARLAQDVSVDAAAEEMRALGTLLNREFGVESSATVAVMRAHDFAFGSREYARVLLLATILVVLLVGALSIATTVLGRDAARTTSLAIHSALGASAARQFRQRLLELGLLLSCGLLIGVGGAAALLRWFARIAAPHLPRAQESDLDAQTIAFACVAVTILGVATAACGGRGIGTQLQRLVATGLATPARHAGRTPWWFVGVELAVALVAVYSAGLLLTSLWRLHAFDFGFRPDALLTIELLTPREWVIDGNESRARFEVAVLDGVRAVPGVAEASLSSNLPFATTGFTGIGVHPQAPPTFSRLSATSDRLFETLGMTLLAGRSFDARDGSGAKVAIVNEMFAKKHFGSASPLGQRIRIRDDYEIVGVVGDVIELTDGSASRSAGLVPTTPPAVYVASAAGLWGRELYLSVRTTGPITAVLPLVRTAVAGASPHVVVRAVGSMADRVVGPAGETRVFAAALSTVAGVTLIAVAVGIFGLVGRAMAERTRELGIRLALGATRGQVGTMVAGQFGRGLLAAVAAGVALALASGGVAERLLFGVANRDYALLGLSAMTVAIAAIVAAAVPVARAVWRNPVVTLRAE